eukprot:m.263182 g.263182  ORF g.263182 m.263182 type:complete len:215 (-) comp54634_c0_seq8:127-771(-)
MATADAAQMRYKLILVGEAGIGKSTFVQRHLTGVFEREHRVAPGFTIYPLVFHTNMGVIHFEAWDSAGQEKFGALQDGFFQGSQCAILMFDVTNRASYKSVPIWYNTIRELCGEIPIVLCGNKVDERDRRVKPKSITFHRKRNLQYYDISAKTNYNYEKPFLWLARRLLGTPQLALIVLPVLRPPELPLDQTRVAQAEEEFRLSNEAVLPDDDD